MRVIVLLGAPGAGKGTQAPILSQRLGLPHVATGDLFRAAVRAGTPVGVVAKRYMDRGELVPDEVVIDLLFERLALPDASGGALLDGFPRTAAQAAALDAALEAHDTCVERAPYISIPEPEILTRLGGRWICRAAQHPYHEVFSPPLVAGVCDIDGSELFQRDDDCRETVEARLRLQMPPLLEVVDHYRRTGVLVEIDGMQPIEDVTDDLLAALAPEIEERD